MHSWKPILMCFVSHPSDNSTFSMARKIEGSLLKPFQMLPQFKCTAHNYAYNAKIKLVHNYLQQVVILSNWHDFRNQYNFGILMSYYSEDNVGKSIKIVIILYSRVWNVDPSFLSQTWICPGIEFLVCHKNWVSSPNSRDWTFLRTHSYLCRNVSSRPRSFQT